MGMISLSMIYGFVTSHFRGICSIIAASTLLVLVFIIGFSYYNLSHVTTFSAIFIAWLFLNIGLAIRFLWPLFRAYKEQEKSSEL